MPPVVMAGHSRLKDGVASARLCPAIHAFLTLRSPKTWMPGTSSAKTRFALLPGHDEVRETGEEELYSVTAFSEICQSLPSKLEMWSRFIGV